MSQAPAAPAPVQADLPDLAALSGLAPELAQTFVSIASDIALVIDRHGVIRNVAVGQDPITSEAASWVGRRWADTVTGDTQRKVEQLLDEVRSAGVTRRREVSHQAPGGADLPVAYAAIRLGRDGPVLAVGRDLRAVAAIQQKFLETQQELERDYWRQRQAESRRLLLLQTAHDAVLVVDPTELKVLVANRAAGRLFGTPAAAFAGVAVTDLVAPSARPGVHELLIMTRASGRPSEMRAHRLPRDPVDARSAHVDLSATPLRMGNEMRLLVRARAVEPNATPLETRAPVAEDAVVITDPSGRVLMANAVFLARFGLVSDGDAVGHQLAELLQADPALLAPVLAQTRREGLAELHAPNGLDLSAALLTEGDQECIGIVLHRLGLASTGMPLQATELALAVDTLAQRVGLATLPDLMREAADLAERHLIEAALARTAGDPRAAALMLGIGLDNLWVRLQHHGIEPPGSPPDGNPAKLLN